jgi:hypothetical protein
VIQLAPPLRVGQPEYDEMEQIIRDVLVRGMELLQRRSSPPVELVETAGVTRRKWLGCSGPPMGQSLAPGSPGRPGIVESSRGTP